MLRSSLMSFMVLCSILSPCSARAGGVYLYEVGNSEVGLAAAGAAARAQEPSTVFTNPAGLVRLSDTQLEFSAQPIYLDSSFNPNENTSNRNLLLRDGSAAAPGNPSTWIPAGSLFVSHRASDQLSLGFGAFSFFGLAMEYEKDWVGRYYVTDVTLQGLSLMPAVAYRFSEEWSVGAGLNLMYTMFEQKAQINNPLPFQTEGQLEIDDETWGVGGNLGLLLEPNAHSRFGISYLTPTKINLETRPKFSGLAPGLEAALRSAGLIDGKVDVGMTAPQAIMFSAYHEISASVSLMGNLGWQNWSKFGKVDLLIASEDPTSLTADRNYEDTWHGGLGAQWTVSEPWRLSLGLSYDSSTVEDRNRTPDLPLGASWRFGGGMRFQASERISLGAAYELLSGGNLEMDVTRGPLAGRVAGTYESTAMHFINLSVNWAL